MIFIVCFSVAYLVAGKLKADPEVVYCKNLKTGQIVVIEKGYACPWGTVRI